MTWKVKQDSPYFLSCLNDAFITYNTTGSFTVGDGTVAVPSFVDEHYQVFTTKTGEYGGLGISHVGGNTWDTGFLEFVRAAGTYASPTALLADTIIGQLSYTGVYGAGWANKSSAGVLDFNTAENWSAGARGSRFDVWTVQIGSTGINKRLEIDGAGDFVYYDNSTTEIFRIDEDAAKVDITGDSFTSGKATFHSETAADGFSIKTYEGEAVHIGVGMNSSKTNGQILICNNAYIDSSFNHGSPASDPTLLLYSATDPASATNEWLGLLHDKSDAFLVTGKGRIILFPNTYTMVGYAGVPGYASSYTDLYVEGILEVDSFLFADGGIATTGITASSSILCLDTLKLGSSTATEGMWIKRVADDGMHIGIGGTDGSTNYNIIICDAAYVDSDHGHGTPSSAPTLFLHEGDPSTGPNKWLAMEFAGGQGYIGTGEGPLLIYPDELTIIGVSSSTSHSLGRHDLFVAGNLEVDTNIFADGNVTVAGVIGNSSGSLTINPTTYTRIGDGSTTSHSLGADGLLVTGACEVDGTLWVDFYSLHADDARAYFGSSGDSILVYSTAQATANALVWGLSADSNGLIFTTAANIAKDFDHIALPSPTIWIHSATDPDSDNTEYLAFYHNTADGYIRTGKGQLWLLATTLTQVGDSTSTSHSLGADDFMVSGDQEVDGILYADGGITVDPSASIDCASGSLNLGGTVNVNFAGATRTASTVTHDGYVELDIAGSTYKFMLGS